MDDCKKFLVRIMNFLSSLNENKRVDLSEPY